MAAPSIEKFLDVETQIETLFKAQLNLEFGAGKTPNIAIYTYHQQEAGGENADYVLPRLEVLTAQTGLAGPMGTPLEVIGSGSAKGACNTFNFSVNVNYVWQGPEFPSIKGKLRSVFRNDYTPVMSQSTASAVYGDVIMLEETATARSSEAEGREKSYSITYSGIYTLDEANRPIDEE